MSEGLDKALRVRVARALSDALVPAVVDLVMQGRKDNELEVYRLVLDTMLENDLDAAQIAQVLRLQIAGREAAPE